MKIKPLGIFLSKLVEMGSWILCDWPWWNCGRAETESTPNSPRRPETKASLVSLLGCPLPRSAVPASSCFPVRSDNQLHETIMAWCGLSALSSWDHSPCNTIADKCRVSPRKRFSTTKWQSGLNSPLSEWMFQLGGHKLRKQWWLSQLLLSFLHPFASDACPVYLALWESYFPVWPCKVPHSLLVDSICNPQWPLGHQNHQHNPIYINGK